MLEIKVGEFLKKHINQIIKLCNQNNVLFENLQNKEYCHETFGLNRKFSLILKLSKLKTNGLDIGLEKKYYVQNYEIKGELFRVCSQFGGNHLLNGIKASPYHGQKLLSFFEEKGILLDEFKNKEIDFIVASPSPSPIPPGIKPFVETSILNQILYGPPGTGKTYNTINRALEIIDGEVPQDRSEAKARFEELSSAGQIEFVTFHQSYGYEEFVEGIKANSVDGEISYDVEDGIFKQLSKRANSKFGLDTTVDSIDFKDYLHVGQKLSLSNGGIIEVEEIADDIKVRNDKNREYLFTLKRNKILEHLKSKFDFNDNLKLGSYQESIANQIYSQLDNSYFSDNTNKNHILIIDEINRGNISKIFGELITLIEPSKRIGASEEIRLRLPYSNDEFGVPSNLYIIGTMNTADRSIALMDTALRRRFEFVEMMPNTELLDFEVAGVNLKALLQKINARVEYLYDRDHTIGHAYFMELNAGSSLDELNGVMRNKIIPLLQEYFYDDWEKIKLVLNDGFIHSARVDASRLFESIDDEYIEEDKLVYSILDVFEKEAYLRLCHTR